jgi:predicted DsbA family dithiol-disulfide isomerase
LRYINERQLFKEELLMKIKIDIFSDAICPWCYVGKKRLEKAVAASAKGHEFDVAWHPYQLNPLTPAEGVSRQDYLSQKFGGPEHLRLMDARMKEVGLGEGIDFHQEKIARTPNTLDAHRLIWLAGKEGRQNETVENLFRAYFTEGQDIGDRAVLTRIAGESGLDPARVAAFLNSDQGRAEVLAFEKQIKEAGIRGVPLFIINGEAVIEGAEPAETFIQTFESLKHTPGTATV